MCFLNNDFVVNLKGHNHNIIYNNFLTVWKLNNQKFIIYNYQYWKNYFCSTGPIKLLVNYSTKNILNIKFMVYTQDG